MLDLINTRNSLKLFQSVKSIDEMADKLLESEAKDNFVISDSTVHAKGTEKKECCA